MKACRFPTGAHTKQGRCEGLFCRARWDEVEVVPARAGRSLRDALAMRLCADCLADFAVAGDLGVHVYALAGDGRFHAVEGEIEGEVVE